ncbi:MAG: tetratricopeptide repeat-containing sensor histidine kinase, partial [Flavobacteriales bacterium]|nr:tetratricopeptide repeat-containing sensor histidine kinase [Flavobacteriales bacterium]
MRRLGWITVLLMISTLFTAQTDQVESQLSSFEALETKASRIDYLDSLCAQYRATLDPSGAIFYDIRDSILGDDWEAGLERAHESTFYHTLIGDIPRGGKVIDTYYPRLRDIEDLNLRANIAYTKSFHEELAQNNAPALEAIEKSIEIHEILQDTTVIQFGESYRAKARILQAMGRFGESSIAYTKAKDIFMAARDSIGISDALMGLGILYAQLGLYDESEVFFQQRYDYASNPPPLMYLQDALNLGRNRMLEGRTQEAQMHFEEGLRLAKEHGLPGHISLYAYNGLIESLYFNQAYESVKEVFIEMKEVYSRYEGDEGLGFLFDQSRFFDLLVRGETQAAEEIATRLYARSAEKGDASERMLHAQFLSELYEKQEDYARSLEYFRQFSATRDSLLTANKTNAILLYQTQYETQEKENEIISLGKEKEREEARSRLFLLIAIGLAAILLLISYLFIQLRRTRKQLQVQNEELQRLNATKTKFFSIIGHDLRSPLVTLHAIGMGMKRRLSKGDVEGAQENVGMLSSSVQQISGLLDNLLGWALSENGVMPYHPEKIELRPTVEETMEHYAELAAQKDIELSLAIPAGVHVHADPDALKGILRNLISNAIKFTPQGGKVELAVEEEGGRIQVLVKDSGVGMSTEQIERLASDGVQSERGTAGEVGTGLGLTLVKELVDL